MLLIFSLFSRIPHFAFKIICSFNSLLTSDYTFHWNPPLFSMSRANVLLYRLAIIVFCYIVAIIISDNAPIKAITMPQNIFLINELLFIVVSII